MKTSSNQQSSPAISESHSQKQAPAGTILQAYKHETAQLGSIENEEPSQQKENKTGLPDNLKSGVENLSGHSLDDVKVHYNSSQPATLQAHAYAQGTDIHVAPGQEKHLPHEAWHVVQQKEGRVQPTKQLKGKTNINDDGGLEKEADVMGAKAMQMKTVHSPTILTGKSSNSTTTQLATIIKHTTDNYSYKDHTDNGQKNQTVGTTMEAFLDPNDKIEGSATGGPQKDFISNIRKTFPNDNMIRGHLLNHDLGGFGVEQNLFPITSYANGLHLRKMEYGVKKALVDAKAAARGVYYKVEVTGAKDDTTDQPTSTFECVAKRWNDVNTEATNGTEILKANIISSPKKTGPKRDSEAKGSSNNGAGGAATNQPHSSGLAAWKHGGRSGKLNFDELITSGKITSTVRDIAEPLSGDLNKEKAQLFIDENEDEFGDIAAYIMQEKKYKKFTEITEDDINALDATDQTLFLNFIAAVFKLAG